MNNISELYDHVRSDSEYKKTHPHAYSQKREELNEQIQSELSEYKKRSNDVTELFSQHSRMRIYIIIIIAVILLAAAAIIIFAVSGNKNSESNDNNIAYSDNSSSVPDSTAVSTEETTVAQETQAVAEETTVTVTEAAVTETTAAVTDSDAGDAAEGEYLGFKKGDVVYFNGERHYKASSAGAIYDTCTKGKATITDINPDSAHPFHLESAEAGGNIFGWVNAEDIVKQ